MEINMLSERLTDQQELDQFVHDKTDRQVALTGLFMINDHVKECSERWRKIYSAIRLMGLGVSLILVDRVASEMPHQVTDIVHTLCSHLLGF
jgi:uncharacterized protein with HEPN domain